MLNGYRAMHRRGYRIQSAQDSMFLLRPFYPHFNFERVIVCGMDKDLNLIYAKQMFSGGYDTVDANPYRVIRLLRESGVAFYILSHNHPEGHLLNPSGRDKDFTRDCDRIGRQDGLIMLDHMIICQDRFWSFRRNGAMRRLKPEDLVRDARGGLRWRESEGWFGKRKVDDIIW